MGSGQKIIDGIQDAIDGHFDRVTVDGQTWAPTDKTYARGWNDAIEKAAVLAVERGDFLEIHGPKIAARIRAFKI